MRAGAWIRLPRLEEPHSTTSIAVVQSLPSTYQVRVHNSCIHSELVALHNRHLVDRSYLPFDLAIWKRAVLHSQPVFRTLAPQWISHWKIARLYVGGKRRVYLRACEFIDAESFGKSFDARVSMFIKPDKYPVSEIEQKPPRAIQFRTPKYNLMLGSYLKDLEHQFYGVSTGPSGTRDIAKGTNVQQRAFLLLQKQDSFKDPVFLNIDYSKMDSCVRVEHQVAMFKWYLWHFPSKLLRALLNAQLRNSCRTKSGIRYGMRGTRCSGDFNTGFENTLLNWVVLRYVSFVADVVVELFLDGDDSFIIMEKGDAAKFKQQLHLFGQLGFEAKCNWAGHISELEFCHTKLIEGPIPTMARDPVRALAHLNVSLRHYPAKVWPRLAQSRYLCEIYSNPGMPVLGPICRRLLPDVKPLWDADTWAKFTANVDVRFVGITAATRQSYWRAWGLDPYDQELLENHPAMNFTTYDSIFATFDSLPHSEDRSDFSG